MARQERVRRRRQANVVASVVGALIVVGVVVAFVVFTNNDHKSSTASGTGTPTATGTTSASASTSASSAAPKAAANSYPCTFTKSGTAARKVTIPTQKKPARTGTVDLAVKTNRGNLTFQLTRATAPCAVESFVSLAQQKYFDKTPCHRLVTSGIFVLQCGDPLGTGAGGPGYTINDEYTGKEKYGTGVIAMANTGAANSSGGQFFIMTKDSNAGLGKTYSVVGKVTSGMNIIEQVAKAGAAGTTGDGKPKLAISITSMRTTE